MPTHNISRRLQFLIQYLNDFPYTSKDAILDFLEEKDFQISARTLERDINRIRADYGLEIVYDKLKNGYYIDEENSVKVESFFKFLEISTLADIFNQSLKDSNKILDYVDFDDSKNLKGIQNLRGILLAIDQNREIHFVHENYYNKTLKNYTIIPLLLKEYENRWYVIGVPDGLDEFRTFGIDRVHQLKLGKIVKRKTSKLKKQLKQFDNIIGLDFSSQNPQKISLLIDALHIKYLKALPLHHSQKIHEKTMDGKKQVDYFLIPNYEFKVQILKMGTYASVIQPESLKEEIKNDLKEMLSFYKN